MIKKSTTIIACVLVFALTAVAVGFVSIAGTILTFGFDWQGSGEASVLDRGDYALLDEIREVMHKYSLWDTDDQRMLENAANAMIYGERDIYASYFTKDGFAQYRDESEGNYQGVGMRVVLDETDGLVTVLYVYKNSPAAKAGVQRGDKIIAVDGQEVAAFDLETVKNMVRGEQGTPVTLGIARETETIALTMNREAVTSENCEWMMISDDVGYLRILEFYGTALELFKEGIVDLQNAGMKGLVLDLRDNPGGDKDMVCAIADMLLPEGKLITMTDKNGKVVDEEFSDSEYLGIPMVVLINENTASASELLSGDIQDFGMGVLVGVTTYGKGVGQTYMTLSDGSVVRYTAFQYLTSSGRCPQDVGISPDVEVEMEQSLLLDWCTDQDAQYMTALDELRKLMEH